VPDSYSPLLIELLFVVGKKKVIQIPTQDFFQSLSWEQNEGSGWRGTIMLFDPHSGYLEDLILAAQSNRLVIVRWGWQQDSKGNYIGLKSQRAYEGYITFYEPTFEQEGLTLKLDVAQQGVIGNVLAGSAPKNGARSWSGQQRVSDIVRIIAQKNRWLVQETGFYAPTGGAPRGEQFTRDTIENSEGIIGRDVIQPSNMKDIPFIRDVLTPMAINQDGDHFFFGLPTVRNVSAVTGGLREAEDKQMVCHFHSEFYSGSSGGSQQKGEKKSKIRLAKSYTFARDEMGEVISFAPTDEKLFNVIEGLCNAQFKGLDSLRGTFEIIEVEELGGVPGSKRKVSRDTRYVTEIGGTRIVAVPLNARSADEVRWRAQHQYSKFRSSAYKAELTVRGTHDVDLLSHIEVNYFRRGEQSLGTDEVLQADGLRFKESSSARAQRTRRPLQKHYLSGTYLVVGITHEVGNGGWTTAFELQRNGHGYAGPDATEQPADITVDLKDAPETQRQDIIPAEVRP
jgi:hypothetical protein